MIDHTIYSGYHNLTNQSVEIGANISISKPEDNCLEASFPSTTSVKFCEKKEMMSFVVTPGDDYKNTTKGLLGTWNDNPHDDFALPDGTVLSPFLTLRQIHFEFGAKCEYVCIDNLGGQMHSHVELTKMVVGSFDISSISQTNNSPAFQMA